MVRRATQGIKKLFHFKSFSDLKTWMDYFAHLERSFEILLSNQKCFAFVLASFHLQATKIQMAN